jgi:hypothetical protein
MLLQTSNVDGLGVMAVFSITGRSHFRENRVIPTLHINELCFGSVPSIYDDDEYLEKHEDAHGLGLMFGSPAVDEDTLESLGCSIETRRRWRRDHTHIFSGMASPLFTPWDKSCFDRRSIRSLICL